MPSPVAMMESVGHLERAAIGRDAQQGVTQTWSTITPSVPCSIQPAGPAVQLLYKQRNSEITTIVYLAQDIGAQVNDRFVYVSPGGETGTLLVLANAQQVNRGVVWKLDAKQIPEATTPAVAGFAVTAPGTASIGVPFSFTVQAVDALGHDISTYSGTVKFYAFTDPLAVLPGPTLITGGVGAFSATFNTKGSQQLYVQDMNAIQWGGFGNNVNVYNLSSLRIGLKANYSFSVDGFLLDSSGNGYTLTNTNLATQGTNGLIGDCATFASVDSQSLNSANVSLSSVQNSFAAWIRPSTLAQSGAIPFNMDSQSAPGRLFILQMDSSGILALTVLASTGGNVTVTDSVNHITAGQWDLIVGVIDTINGFIGISINNNPAVKTPLRTRFICRTVSDFLGGYTGGDFISMGQ